jgi:phage-related protein
MPQTPFWAWCPQPGAARTTELRIDSNAMGDGYIHRATRGLHPNRPTWSLAFPFVGLDELQAMDFFLETNAACGFWMQPPDQVAAVLVYCDAWSVSMTDKNADDGIIGTLQANFVRCFNPQPVTP